MSEVTVKNWFKMIPVLGCVAAVLLAALTSCSAPVQYRFHVRNADGEAVSGAEVEIVYTTSMDFSGKTSPETVTRKGVTDSKGDYTYRGLTRFSPSAGASKEGYYRTANAPISGREMTIVLREIRRPVAMYAKVTRIELLRSKGDFSYDLVAGDLVAPDGAGEDADLVLRVSPGVSRPGGSDLDISFSHPEDGIQPILLPERIEPRSDYNFPYEAPPSGYLLTLEEANGNWAEVFAQHLRGDQSRSLPEYWYWTECDEPSMRSWAGEINYIFRVRCGGEAGCLYGKIYGEIEARSDPDGAVDLSFTYYLNPTGGRSLEFGENLFEEFSQRFERTPPIK